MSFELIDSNKVDASRLDKGYGGTLLKEST